ncbi:TPA: hypothetical protein ACF0SI_002807 [Enterococcus hirae]
MKQTEITTYIALGLSFINIIVSIYIATNQPKTNRINPILEKQLKEIFVPHQNPLNKQLFKKITKNNVKDIHSILETLHTKIKDTEIEFSLSFFTVYYLDKITKIGIPISKKQFKTYNKNYRQFSLYYLHDLNKLRKNFGLPKYNLRYRLWFDLYPNKFQKILIYLFLFIAFTIITIIYATFIIFLFEKITEIVNK